MELKDAQALTTTLMKEHGLVGWKFEWSIGLSFAGKCWYQKKVIALSKHWTVAMPEEKVRDTVLHEIAHALAGPNAKHGIEWKKVAIRLGCNPKASFKPTKEQIKIAYASKGKPLRRAAAPTYTLGPLTPLPAAARVVPTPRKITRPTPTFSGGFTNIEALFGDEYA